MAIAHIPQIPLRTTQSSKLASLQHDNIHSVLRGTINAIIDRINELEGITSALPAGISLEYSGASLPTGRYLWEDGTILTRSLYPQLFAAIGTTWNTGGETGSQFRLPNRMGKVSVCANPMNGQTDGTLSTRTLGTYFGAQSNPYSPAVTVAQATLTATPTGTVALSPYTPTGTISINGFTPTGSVTITPFTGTGTITVDPYEGDITPTGTIEVTLTNGSVTGSANITVSGASCFSTASTGEKSAIDCTSTLVVSSTSIAASLTTDVSINTQTFTGDAVAIDHTHNASLVMDEQSVTATFNGTPVTLTGTFTGAASSQTASFTGTPQNINHTHSASLNSLNVSTMQPALVKNFIITY